LVGGGGSDSTGSGQGLVASCYECSDEPLGSGTMELVERENTYVYNRTLSAGR
jgi:hypothetical protein